MRPENNHWRTAAFSVAGLALGAVLGYQFPTSAPVVLVGGETNAGPAMAAPSTEAGKPRPPDSPYEMEPVLKGGSQKIAEFEAWLSTASCDEVTKVMLDNGINTYPGSPPLNALLMRRFGEFSVDERFTCLQSNLRDKQKIQNYDLLEVFSDLAKDTLPRRAEEILELFKKGSQLNSYSIGNALGSWAAADFPAAIAFVGRIEGHGKDQVAERLIGNLAATDLALAQREAMKLPWASGGEDAFRAVAAHMAKTELIGTLDWLAKNGVPTSGRYGGSGPYHSAVMSAASADAAATAQLIMDQPGLFEGERGPQMVGDLFRQWAGRDPAAASAWLEAHPLSETHQKTATRALADLRWQKLTPDQALSEFSTLPGNEQVNRIGRLADKLVEDDPSRAVERLAALLPKTERSEKMLGNLLERLPAEYLPQAIRQFPEMVAEFAKTGSMKDRMFELPAEQMEEVLPLLPEKMREEVRKGQLRSAVISDPDLAMKLVEGMDRDQLDPFVSSTLGVRMAESDPQKAATWVAEIAEGPAKEWAALNLVANWAKYDPDTAVGWLETLPQGRSRDRAALEAAKIQGVTGNHETALMLAAGLGNAKERAEATGFALQQLWTRDPAAAANALSSSGLAPEQQADVEKKLQQGGFTY